MNQSTTFWQHRLGRGDKTHKACLGSWLLAPGSPGRNHLLVHDSTGYTGYKPQATYLQHEYKSYSRVRLTCTGEGQTSDRE